MIDNARMKFENLFMYYSSYDDWEIWDLFIVKVFGQNQRALVMKGMDLCHQNGEAFVKLTPTSIAIGFIYLQFFHFYFLSKLMTYLEINFLTE